jgi:hypothetical protein
MISVTLAWILTSVLGVLSLFLIVANYIGGFVARVSKANFSSIPFLGGIFGLLALLTCPIERVHRFAWIPLIVDLSIPGFMYAVLILRAFRSKKS